MRASPIAVRDATGGVLRSNSGESVPVIFAGKVDDMLNRHCYRLHQQVEEDDSVFATLPEGKKGPAGAVIHHGSLLATPGL